VNACKEALDGGVVAGGGVALKDISLTIQGPTDGLGVVARAIYQPFFLLVQSAGYKLGYEAGQGGGLNVKTGKPEKDMISAGIMDPVKVTKSALANAASLAGVFLTTEVAIVDLPMKYEERHS
jgi:chaperonin GroEL